MWRRRTRTQKEWKVEISGGRGRLTPRFESNAATRSFICSAALLVKVTATMLSGGTPRASIR